MAKYSVRVEYGPDEFIVEAPGADEAKDKAWNDAIEQLMVGEPEELAAESEPTPE